MLLLEYSVYACGWYVYNTFDTNLLHGLHKQYVSVYINHTHMIKH